ncbi:betaine/proline/choline family ABC transporter ATP-binding protein [Paenibacillus qinlingensis]|uniref:betaine/proline/choline family ABC transporter ATP-binding protein n=1 Tax=Paenibacillus qinlingensis TaxID=1837343 RepID=UPI00156571EE|nr:betaine/proline/choline family ABC transporter ATP-binding protein [Paenibacillus qinlingensis]NQX59686.1 betaine/proline/choline family ABC transporter ATP-binding protein [Paenibacillus qinlingensis]
MSGIALEFKQVSKNYGAGIVLENFNLTVPKERIVTIIGPSGCGKTTILKMINRLIEPEAGQILLEGKDIGALDPVELRRNIGYVIQQIGLFPHMTIEENISIVPRLKGESKKQLVARTEELLELIGLDPTLFRKRYPHELSGGQQQRIGVARALAANPSIILMDEPFSALDPISRLQLQKELIHLNKHVKKTIVFVTHDIDEALKIADQIIVLKEGKVVQAATPEELLKQPASAFVREFVGQEKFQPVVAERTVVSVMNNRENILSVRPDVGISEALRQLQDNQVRDIIVTCSENKFLGVVGIDDLSQGVVSEANSSITRVADIMRTDVPSIGEHSPIAQVFSLLNNYHIVPVVDEAQRLLGAITQTSFIKAIAHSAERKEVIA